VTSSINYAPFSDEQLKQLLSYLEESVKGKTQSSVHQSDVKNEHQILVAYYVSQINAGGTNDDECKEIPGSIEEKVLREFCSARLPVHMCPTRYIALNKFPTLPNGKLSYKMLPRPTAAKRENGNDSSNTSEEAKLVLALLGDILGMEGVLISDNFFEIGGDSISAIQFISKAREKGLNIDIAAVSESNTIAEMISVCQLKTTVQPSDSHGEKSESVTNEKPFAASGLDETELDDFLQSFSE